MKEKILITIILLFSVNLGFAQTLDDYFKIAAENNPGLQAKYYEYEAALQKVPQVDKLPDPVFSFGYFISPVETRVGAQQAKFSLSQMFPWFGSLKAQGDAAALMAEAKFQNFINERNKLYYRLATAYYPLFELRDLVKIEQENIKILESYKTISTQKYKSGSGSMVDVLRVDIMLNDAQTNLNILKDKEIPLKTSFNKILNRAETENIVIQDSLSLEKINHLAIKDSMIEKNPNLKALELKFQASKSAEIVAQKQGLPMIGLGLDYVIVSEREDINLNDNGKDILMPMVSFSLPIFRSKYKASVKEAQLMQQSYKYQKEEIANSLISNYEEVSFEIQQQVQYLNLYNQQIETLEIALNLQFTSYENSGKEFEEVLDMQQQLLKYQKLKAEAMTKYQIAIAKINYLTSKEY